jgi:hypothetical protein
MRLKKLNEMEESTKPDFWEILQDHIEDWEELNGDITCNEHYESAVVYVLEQVWRMTKRGEI